MEPIIIKQIVYTTYTPAHQRACKKYYEKNKEKMIERQKQRDDKTSESKKIFRQLAKLVGLFT